VWKPAAGISMSHIRTKGSQGGEKKIISKDRLKNQRRILEKDKSRLGLDGNRAHRQNSRQRKACRVRHGRLLEIGDDHALVFERKDEENHGRRIVQGTVGHTK